MIDLFRSEGVQVQLTGKALERVWVAEVLRFCVGKHKTVHVRIFFGRPWQVDCRYTVRTYGESVGDAIGVHEGDSVGDNVGDSVGKKVLRQSYAA